MNLNPIPPKPRARTRWVFVVLLLLALMLLPFAVLGVGVLRCLHVSRDTSALRNSILDSGGANWDKTVEVHTGPVLWGLARAGLSLVDIPVQARTALRAIRGAEVAVYRSRARSGQPAYGAMLDRTDATMSARGWTRLVGVVNSDEMVAVYVPERTCSARDVRICVVVLNREDLVVASARSNLEPLMELALSEPDWRHIGSSTARF